MSKAVSSFVKAGVTHGGATRNRTDVRRSPATPKSATISLGRFARISESLSQDKHRSRRSSGRLIATADLGGYAAGFRSFKISRCNFLKSFGGMASDFLTNLTAEAGQGTAQTPQPMHHSLSTTGKSPSLF